MAFSIGSLNNEMTLYHRMSSLSSAKTPIYEFGVMELAKFMRTVGTLYPVVRVTRLLHDYSLTSRSLCSYLLECQPCIRTACQRKKKTIS